MALVRSIQGKLVALSTTAMFAAATLAPCEAGAAESSPGEPRAAETAEPTTPTFPRLAGGVRLGIGSVVIPGSGSVAEALSGRVGARFSPGLALYGEIGGAPAFRGGQSASSSSYTGYGRGSVLLVLAPYGSLLLGVRPRPSFEIAVGPTFGALYAFPPGTARSPLRVGGTVHVTLLLAKKTHRPGGVGFYFAPSLDAIVLAGDVNGATVYVGMSPLAFEWM